MKPSDTNTRTLGLLGLLYIYKRKYIDTCSSYLLPYSLSRSLATFSDPATFCALQRWAENVHIIARAFPKGGWWLIATDPGSCNLLNSIGMRVETAIESHQKSIICRSGRLQISQVNQANRLLYRLLWAFPTLQMLAPALIWAVTWWRAI